MPSNHRRIDLNTRFVTARLQKLHEVANVAHLAVELGKSIDGSALVAAVSK